MKNSKEAWIIFRRIITVLFIIFLINYYQVESGNYKNSTTQRTVLTEEKIREFEEDVKNGKFVDIKNYTETDTVDTTTTTSNVGYKIGEGIDKIVNEKADGIIKIIKKYFM